MEKTEFEQMRDKVLEQLMKGQSLTGKDGLDAPEFFAPLLQQFLESALVSEINAHFNEQERESGNKRTGKGSKRLKIISNSISLTFVESSKKSRR